MSKTTRRARDAIMGLIATLAAFAYQQILAGRYRTAAITAIVIGALFTVYRYADARVIEAVADAEADELKPVLRRLGRLLRRK